MEREIVAPHGNDERCCQVPHGFRCEHTFERNTQRVDEVGFDVFKDPSEFCSMAQDLKRTHPFTHDPSRYRVAMALESAHVAWRFRECRVLRTTRCEIGEYKRDCLHRLRLIVRLTIYRVTRNHMNLKLIIREKVGHPATSYGTPSVSNE